MNFEVFEKSTMKYPDLEKLALNEEWSKHLIYCDIDGFMLSEDGVLYLMDD